MSAIPDSEFQHDGGPSLQPYANDSLPGETAAARTESPRAGWGDAYTAAVAAGATGRAAPDQSPAQTSEPAPTGDLESDPHYLSMLTMMQYGKWPEVLDMLTRLKAQYPDEPILDSLLTEARLKSDLVITWGTKIKGRKLTVRQERFLRRSIPFVVLIMVAFVGLSFYQSFIAPSRQVVAMANKNQQTIEKAQAMTQNGQYEEALRLYEEVLARDPGNVGALQGIQEAQEMIGLVAKFDLAMDLAKEGNVDRALAFLEEIQVESPGFRNVDAQIKQLQTQKEVQALFEAAEAAYAQQQWLTAAPLYEQVLEMARDFHTDEVEQHLLDSYYQGGLALTTMLPSPDAGPEKAQEYLRKGKSVDPTQAKLALKRLDIYFDGMKALDEGKLDEAINLWQGLYDANPAYLGGYLAGRLYAAYLSLAAQAEQQMNYAYAQSLYEQALGLQVEDVSGAQTRLAALLASIEPTPTPAPAAQPAVYAPPPPPTPTPEPDMSGWIAFRTNRNGAEEIYVMRPDGTEQQPAPAGLAMRFEELYQQERISWDGSRELRVMSPNGRSDANIYLVDLTIPEGQPRESMLTDFNRDEYDPVWSPQGDRIAFVSNHTGNDEIWTVNADGTGAYQLTWNEWEWDKHPSFSPDGGQIVFYSNRSGWRQIWVMDSNGGTQRNLSFNAYEDWDPIWIK